MTPKAPRKRRRRRPDVQLKRLRKPSELDELYDRIMGTLPVPPHVHLAPARQVPIEEYLARKAAETAKIA